jgi:FkbM family methyltransferase
VIFDVGAHVGDTVAKYRSLFPKAHIHCFEPFPGSYDRLAANVAGKARTHLHRVALADREGATKLNINRSAATNSLLSSDSRGSFYWGEHKLETESAIDVVTNTVDRVRLQESIDHIDILKIDVQGAEYAVLQGADATLRQHVVDVLYMELIVAPTYIGQHRLQEYLAHLDSLGYLLFDFYNPARKHGRLIQADALFVSEPFLAQHERQAQSTT